MSNPGLGVMIGMLGGNEKTVAAVKSSLGKTILSAWLKDDVLRLTFTDGTTLKLWDDGQSCCESRYMVCDADLPAFTGATLVNIELREGPSLPAGEEHETQFLNVVTSKGIIDAVTHNEHNGYYGGFWIVASVEDK
jgi:hypothetical protein